MAPRTRLVFLLLPTLLLGGCAANRRAADLEVSAVIPPRLVLGETKTIQLALSNKGTEPLTVRDIDIQRTLLAATVEPSDGSDPRVEPRLSISTDVAHSVVELHGYRALRVSMELAPGETRVVGLTVSADRDWLPAADFRGETVAGHLDVSLGAFHNRTVPVTMAILPTADAPIPGLPTVPVAPPAEPSGREAGFPPDQR